MEADSLNASILGPDAAPGTEEFDLFVKEVAREMTAKAGQKCTAIRRALVPRAFSEAVLAALSKRLAGVAVGDPREEATRMGALASFSQREEVRARIAELAHEAEIVAGDPNKVTLASGDAERGAFLNPVLLYCEKPGSARAVHEVEAFGPVATVMPYDGLDEAIALAHRGGGSLVASVFTNDASVAREAALGLAHARPPADRQSRQRQELDRARFADARPRPRRPGARGRRRGARRPAQRQAFHAAHGGAGRAAALVGRHRAMDRRRAGQRRAAASVPKIARRAEDRRPLVTAERTVTLDDIEHFAAFTGDTFYAHMDEAAAKANPLFGGRVAHGYLIVSFAAGLFVDPAPGPVLANYGVDNLRFLTPVKPGDTLRATLTCKEINPRGSAEHGEVRWDCKVTNQTGAVVARYDVLTMVAKTWG